MLAAYSDKSAYAQCIFAYSEGEGKQVELFIGRTKVCVRGKLFCDPTSCYYLACLLFSFGSKGRIVPARGPPNFGWDPIFQPEGFEETYAELDSSVKNTISHRYKALDALGEFLLRETECVPPDPKRTKEDIEENKHNCSHS